MSMRKKSLDNISNIITKLNDVNVLAIKMTRLMEKISDTADLVIPEGKFGISKSEKNRIAVLKNQAVAIEVKIRPMRERLSRRYNQIQKG